VAFFDSSHPLVIAHRGLARDYPENTLPAFAAGLEAGADILETDVHVSKDGQVIVAHDSTLDRVAGLPGRIADYTAQQLADIDLGGGIGFPTLVELLEAFPQAKINIDVKTPEAVPAFVDAIIQLRATERVLVASFDEASRVSAVSQLDGVATSASKKHFLPGLMCSLATGGKCLANIFDGIDAVQAPVFYLGVKIVSKRFVSQLTQIGKQFHVWTINDADQMATLFDLGVTGIMTDRADVAVEVRNQYISDTSGG
jgi:glycerophosphoryl diester phosphodiesterase